jgi:ADP-ribose pyrophosphatase YjhB (NUDIX family)
VAREYPEHPLVGVGVVVWRDDHVLLIRRGKPPKQHEWSLPGGSQELGETVAQAAQREVFEETGLQIDVQDVVAVVDLIDHDDDGRVRFHYTLVDLLAEWRAGTARAGDDAAEVTWTTIDQLAHFMLWSETERVIKLAAERRKERSNAYRGA